MHTRGLVARPAGMLAKGSPLVKPFQTRCWVVRPCGARAHGAARANAIGDERLAAQLWGALTFAQHPPLPPGVREAPVMVAKPLYDIPSPALGRQVPGSEERPCGSEAAWPVVHSRAPRAPGARTDRVFPSAQTASVIARACRSGVALLSGVSMAF